MKDINSFGEERLTCVLTRGAMVGRVRQGGKKGVGEEVATGQAAMGGSFRRIGVDVTVLGRGAKSGGRRASSGMRQYFEPGARVSERLITGKRG
jgi:hypothetical protein